MIYGSVNNYIKQKSLWIKAQRSLNDYTPASENQLITRLNEQLKETNAANKMSAILNRMRMGKRLSKAEKEYLRKNSPDLYRKYQSIEAERDGHARTLKNAKSKKDAARIQQMKAAQLYGECCRTSSGPEGEYQVYRAAAVREEYNEYLAKSRKDRKVKEQGTGDSVSISGKRGADSPSGTGRKMQTLIPEAPTKAGRKKAVARYKAVAKI